MRIEIRRNRSITAKIEGDFSALADMFTADIERLKRENEQWEQYRRQFESELWKQIEESPVQVLDQLGHPVRRETHEICWEPAEELNRQEDGYVKYAMRPYIQPIQSEWQP